MKALHTTAQGFKCSNSSRCLSYGFVSVGMSFYEDAGA